MVKKIKTTKIKVQENAEAVQPEVQMRPHMTLTEAYTKKRVRQSFRQWMVGTSPLITHAWSEKAKREMLAKMVKAVRHTKEERNPNEEFAASLYDCGDGTYGFPVTAIKKAVLSVAHKDRGIAKTDVKSALWLGLQHHPTKTGSCWCCL